MLHAGELPGLVASTHYWSVLQQTVNLEQELRRRGFTAAEASTFLDTSPLLQISVCYGARFDCEAAAKVSV